MKLNKLCSRISIGALVSTVITVAANPAQATSFTNSTTINFDEVEVGLEAEDNPLYGGQNIDNLWSSYGLEMSSDRNALWLYDTSKKGRDNDLLTGQGSYNFKKNVNGKKVKHKVEYSSLEQNKVLIIQEDNGNKNEKKLRPDDNVGGTITFDFTDNAGVLFDSINLLDFDEANDPKFSFKFADDYGDITNATVNNNNNIGVQLLSDNWITNLETGNREQTGENSLREYKFNFKDEDGNLRKVTEFSVNLSGSGAITGLNYRRKVPEPTSILGLAAISGLAASSLKRKRKSSNI